MATLSLETLQQDRLAMSVAQAVSVANDAALRHGTDPANSSVTITEHGSLAARIWRVHYGPRDYVGRRGGDLIVGVDEQAGTVQEVIRGQ